MTDQAPITPEERKALVEAAEKATKAKDFGWQVHPDLGAFIALANPSTVLRLEAALTAAEAEIERLNERLENNRVYGVGGIIYSVEPGSIPDGIECRDETIKLLEARATKAEGERDYYRQALSGIEKHDAGAAGVAASFALQPSSPTEGGGEGSSRISQDHQCADTGSLPALAGWRPINTAPKDGTKVLVWREGWDFAPVAHWDWIDTDGDGSCWGWMFNDDCIQVPMSVDSGFVGWNEDREDGAMPTHWFPTPSTTPDTSTGEDNV